jgi:hypothetical protein
MEKQTPQFIICINNSDYLVSLRQKFLDGWSHQLGL